jgi:hypothetical protein
LLSGRCVMDNEKKANSPDMALFFEQIKIIVEEIQE